MYISYVCDVMLFYSHFSLATAQCNVTLQYMHPVIFRNKLRNKHATWQLVNCWIPKSGLVFCRNLRFTKRNWIKRLLMMLPLLLLWTTLWRLYSIQVINVLKYFTEWMEELFSPDRRITSHHYFKWNNFIVVRLQL